MSLLGDCLLLEDFHSSICNVSSGRQYISGEYKAPGNALAAVDQVTLRHVTLSQMKGYVFVGRGRPDPGSGYFTCKVCVHQALSLPASE